MLKIIEQLLEEPVDYEIEIETEVADWYVFKFACSIAAGLLCGSVVLYLLYGG
jgi:hypothetical protein